MMDLGELQSTYLDILGAFPEPVPLELEISTRRTAARSPAPSSRGTTTLPNASRATS